MENVSPVWVWGSFATAPMSPAGTSETLSWSLPLSANSCPIRSSVPWVALWTEVSGRTFPLKTRNIVMCPTNGSETVLNTKAVSGPFASHDRVCSSPPLAITANGARSAGDGNSSTMKSRSRSIPIAFEAEPTKTGARRAFAKPAFAPWAIVASGSVPSSRYCSIRASSDSATASMSFSRAGSAIAWISSGQSDSSARGPDG